MRDWGQISGKQPRGSTGICVLRICVFWRQQGGHNARAGSLELPCPPRRLAVH
jgi:hypothetical protein